MRSFIRKVQTTYTLYIVKLCFQQARFLAIPSQVFHHMAVSRNGCVPWHVLLYPGFSFHLGVFKFSLLFSCSVSQQVERAQFLRPKSCTYPRKTFTKKTTVAAGPWQTDKREASRIENHEHFSFVFHVQRIDVITIFKGSPILTVGYLLGLESYHFDVIFQGFPGLVTCEAVESVNTVLNAELKGFDVSKQKEKRRVKHVESRPKVRNWRKYMWLYVIL